MKNSFLILILAIITAFLSFILALCVFFKKVIVKKNRTKDKSFKDDLKEENNEESDEKLEKNIVSENSKEWEIFSLE